MEENKNVWILVFVVVALLLLFGSFGIGGYGMMGFGMGSGLPFMLLFWGLLLWLVVALVHASQSNKSNSSDSLTILKRRYAKGEISKQQFQEMKKELE